MEKEISQPFKYRVLKTYTFFTLSDGPLREKKNIRTEDEVLYLGNNEEEATRTLEEERRLIEKEYKGSIVRFFPGSDIAEKDKVYMDISVELDETYYNVIGYKRYHICR